MTMGFRLKVSPIYSERERKHGTRFVLETSQSFASFIYDLSVEEHREGRNIRLRVVGLKPPQLSIPSSGPARFVRDYDDLAGTCHVTIETTDGRTSTFVLHISSRRIEAKQPHDKQFTELVL
jgi:hypothetical protein